MSLNIHQKLIATAVAISFILSMYDVLFHLLMGTLHILFESAEYLLDLIIESLLETGTHETQIIVFYILVSLILSGIYWLYHFLINRYTKLKQNFSRQTAEISAQWQVLSILSKMAWWSFFLTAINCWLFL